MRRLRPTWSVHAREVSAQASRRLRASLAELHPEIGWTDEEARPDGRDYWLYDPIDGAYHFLQGLPLWSSSLALIRHGRAVASIVYDPKGDELFAAIENGGTTCNGVPVAVSPKNLHYGGRRWHGHTSADASR